ncbi:unnamed protein product [Danaus chrysippus]|uniref:(African queen) hypothetical protein n=1 Tax=Danaus chrysippus TaxID=151541 RepID=A0A8J2QG23_9NEOP|nr:unnamed protein product [Danaus chrysippus]
MVRVNPFLGLATLPHSRNELTHDRIELRRGISLLGGISKRARERATVRKEALNCEGSLLSRPEHDGS